MNRKPISEIRDDIQDEEYWYLTMFESLDEEKRNDILRRLYHSALCKDKGLALSNAESLQIAIDAEVETEAQRIQDLPRSPLLVAFDDIMEGFPKVRSAA